MIAATTNAATALDVFLWGVLPYIAFTLLIGGLIWRYKTDQFGWTSRSSQLREGKLLRAASPMFHFGILIVGAGHIMGLAFPKEFTETMGVSEHMYHMSALIVGGTAGLVTVLGLVLLIYRRIVYKSVRLATTRNDLFMYVLLCIPIFMGMIATAVNQIFGVAGGYDYRESISPWFRSIFTFQPDVSLMVDIPLTFKIHIVAGLLLFAIWPFTRLVHVLSAPVMYPTRPYVVYRGREPYPAAAKERRGWEPVRKNKQPVDAAPSQGA